MKFLDFPGKWLLSIAVVALLIGCKVSSHDSYEPNSGGNYETTPGNNNDPNYNNVPGVPDGQITDEEGCTHYVSISGNDRNSGLTKESSWRTLSHAARVPAEGSVICVMEGLYQERVVVEKANLTFQGYPRLAPTSDGGFELRADNVSIRGFKITTSITSDWPDRYPLFIRDNRASVLNNYFFDVRGGAAIQGNWNEYPQNVWIAFNKIYKCAAGINVQGESWVVEYNDVEKLHNYGFSDADYSRFHGDNHILRHNIFHGTVANEIGSAHVDCFQTFDGGNWATHTQNILIEHNVCFGFHQGIMSEAANNQNTDSIIVRNNVFANFENAFINTSHGIIVHDIPNYTIKNNTFVNIGVRGVLIKRAEYGLAKFEIVKNNIFFNSGGTAYSFWDGTNTSKGGYNLLFQTGNPNPFWPNDIIDIDPDFYSINDRDFRIRPGSPACDGGEGGSYIGAFPCE